MTTHSARQRRWSKFSVSLPAVAALLLAACSGSSPLAPEGVALDLVANDVTSGSHEWASPAGTLFHVLDVALDRLAQEDGRAEAIHAHLRELNHAVISARESGDESAVHAAVNALEQGAARVILHALGPTVVRRVLHAGADGIHALHERLRAPHTTDHDRSRLLRRVLHAATAEYEAAHSAAEAGNSHAALRHGARVLDILAHTRD